MLTVRPIAATLALACCSTLTTGAPAPDDRAPSPTAELRARARPLTDAASLDPLIEAFGDRRCVLLGETSHGTDEWYVWRAEITRRLVAERGFRFVAFEGDWAAWREVNRYVRHEPGAAASGAEALEAFTRWPAWMWNNQPTLELVEWLRSHNESLAPTERVGVYGIDLYGLPESLEKVPRHLATLDPDAARDAERAYACLGPFALEPQRYVAAVQQLGRSCEDMTASVVRALRRNAEAWRAADAEAYFHAKQNALVAMNAEAHYRTMPERGATSWNIRARHFHETVERLLERYGDDGPDGGPNGGPNGGKDAPRGIVWAHNTHIGDARATPMAERGMVNIGQLVRERHGDDAVALIGFETHGGTVVAGRRWGDERRIMTVPTALAGSLGNLLARVSAEPFMLIIDEVRDAAAFRGRIGHRAIGVTYDPAREQANYVPTDVTRRYDALLFVPETTALRPVARPVETLPSPASTDQEPGRSEPAR